jgi:hypothetical protein
MDERSEALVVDIERCQDCKGHGDHTHHSEAAYGQAVELVRAALERAYPDIRVLDNAGPDPSKFSRAEDVLKAFPSHIHGRCVVRAAAALQCQPDAVQLAGGSNNALGGSARTLELELSR